MFVSLVNDYVQPCKKKKNIIDTLSILTCVGKKLRLLFINDRLRRYVNNGRFK